MKQLLPVILLFLFQHVLAQHEMQVNASELNVRTGAGKEFESVDLLHKNDIVKAYESENGWTEIEYQGKKGYFVSSEFLVDLNESNSNEPEGQISKPEKSKFWFIAGILIILFVIYRVYTFLYAIFGKSNSGSSTRPTQIKKTEPHEANNEIKPKVNPLHWYHCKNCNIRIEAGKQPTSLNCSGDTFHIWTDLGAVGNQAYSCKNCGTTVYTTKQPTSLNCPRETFHKWTKLS